MLVYIIFKFDFKEIFLKFFICQTYKFKNNEVLKYFIIIIRCFYNNSLNFKSF